MTPPFQILCMGAAAPDLSTSSYGPFTLDSVSTLGDVAKRLREQPQDALLLQVGTLSELDALSRWASLSHAVLDAAVVVVAPEPPAPVATRLLQLGVQDVIPQREASASALARSLRLGVERKRLEQTARKAYASDLATGLPNHAQLFEHMTHLLALREREPAPMALLALRLEGLATTEATLGAEAANVLRRKAAVRLRSGLRASDVVASVGADAFAVLLAWIDAPSDGQRVVAKLAQSLQQPFTVAGRDQALAISTGVSTYPDDGKDADTLLRLALGQASHGVGQGRAGFANRLERGQVGAANDEGPL